MHGHPGDHDVLLGCAGPEDTFSGATPEAADQCGEGLEAFTARERGAVIDRGRGGEDEFIMFRVLEAEADVLSDAFFKGLERG